MKDQSVESEKVELSSKPSTQGKGFAKGFLKTDVVFVDQDMPIIEVAKLMRDRSVGDVIVTKFSDKKSKPVGIITDRDLVLSIIADKKSPETMRASDLMIHPVTVAKDTDGIYELIKTMKKEGIGRLPVVDEEGGLIGIITAKKLLQLLSEEFNDLINFNRKSPRKDITIQH